MPLERQWRLRIEDVIAAIDAIHTYIDGLTLPGFCIDRKTRDAVVLNLAVMGEAARFVPEEIKERHPDVPWDEMYRNRNVMIHVYFDLKPEILWNTVHKDLPPLREQLVQVLLSEAKDI